MKKKILVAPLNWGIGHATRCIPIINWLVERHFEPIIASDGDALLLLKKEFPHLKFITLPSFNISYSKNGRLFKLKLLKQMPQALKTLKAEKLATQKIIEENKIDGIISDNRFGVYSKDIPSVIITHQLNVLSGSTSFISSKINQFLLKKFNEIWIPDFKNEPSLSGKLGHFLETNSFKANYLGPLSRFNKPETDTKIKYKLLVLLSGPEPQRGILEAKLLEQLKTFVGEVLFVKGKIEHVQTCDKNGSLTVYNFMTSEALENAINTSETIICRSGYTTVMDLAKLGKRAFFIPTPGQFEQEYLANRFNELKLLPYSNQKDFSLNQLECLPDFKGLNMDYKTPDLEALFRLF